MAQSSDILMMTDLNLLVELLLWCQDHYSSLDLVHAGDQQGTIAGDLLTEVLTQALRPATKMELQDNRLATSNATSRLQGLPHVVMTHVEAARLDIVNNRTTPFLSGLLTSG